MSIRKGSKMLSTRSLRALRVRHASGVKAPESRCSSTVSTSVIMDSMHFKIGSADGGAVDNVGEFTSCDDFAGIHHDHPVCNGLEKLDPVLNDENRDIHFLR